MTDSEAGQIILEGNKRELCKRCDGTGILSQYSDPEYDVDCRSCGGMGSKLRLEYMQALNQLDMGEP